MSITLVMSGNESSFTTNYSPSICTDGKYEAALLSFDMYNSIPNVIEGVNNVFEYTPNDSEWFSLQLDTGSYEIADINDEIQRLMVGNGHYNKETIDYYINISTNTAKLKSIINISHEKYKVRFLSSHSIGPLLGFPKNHEIGIGYNEPPQKVDISKINLILVHTDIIMGSYVNGSSSAVIYSFGLNVLPGYKINERPNPVIYYPVSRSNINRIKIWLTDQDDNLLDVRNETITVRIHVRKI